MQMILYNSTRLDQFYHFAYSTL